jgi:hypothetical protein
VIPQTVSRGRGQRRAHRHSNLTWVEVHGLHYNLPRLRDSSVGIATRFGDQIPVRTRFSTPIQTVPGAHPVSYIMGDASLSWAVKAARACCYHQSQSSAEVNSFSTAVRYKYALLIFKESLESTENGIFWIMKVCMDTRLRYNGFREEPICFKGVPMLLKNFFPWRTVKPEQHVQFNLKVLKTSLNTTSHNFSQTFRINVKRLNYAGTKFCDLTSTNLV